MSELVPYAAGAAGGLLLAGVLAVRSKLTVNVPVVEDQPGACAAGAGAGAGAAGASASSATNKVDDATAEVQLFEIGKSNYLGSPSPFCFKVEVLCRLAGVPFRAREGDIRTAPKGKLPCLRDDGMAGKPVIADSTLIVNHLVATRGGSDATFGGRLAGVLDAEREATLHSLRVMFEQNLYWGMVYERWCTERGYATIGPSFARLPLPLRVLIPRLARNGCFNDSWAHGVARLSEAERIASWTADVDAAAAILGDRQYFGGDKPHAVDAVAFAFLQANLHNDDPEQNIAPLVRRHANLVAYVDRVIDNYFADRKDDDWHGNDAKKAKKSE